MVRQASKHIALEAESCFTQVRMRQISERQHRGERKRLWRCQFMQSHKKGKGKKKKASPFSGATIPLSSFMNLTWWRKPELFSQPA